MGFPIGGDYLSITEGVLSRIEAAPFVCVWAPTGTSGVDMEPIDTEFHAIFHAHCTYNIQVRTALFQYQRHHRLFGVSCLQHTQTILGAKKSAFFGKSGITFLLRTCFVAHVPLQGSSEMKTIEALNKRFWRWHRVVFTGEINSLRKRRMAALKLSPPHANLAVVV